MKTAISKNQIRTNIIDINNWKTHCLNNSFENKCNEPWIPNMNNEIISYEFDYDKFEHLTWLFDDDSILLGVYQFD